MTDLSDAARKRIGRAVISQREQTEFDDMVRLTRKLVVAFVSNGYLGSLPFGRSAKWLIFRLSEIDEFYQRMIQLRILQRST